MNREEAIRAMLDGKKVKQPKGEYIYYLDSNNYFVYESFHKETYKVDVNCIVDYGWKLYEEPKPKKRYMTREEVLGFVCNTPGIVVMFRGGRWEYPGAFSYTEIKDYEYAYIDKSGNIGEPHKFMVDEY